MAIPLCENEMLLPGSSFPKCGNKTSYNQNQNNIGTMNNKSFIYTDIDKHALNLRDSNNYLELESPNQLENQNIILA